MFVGGPKTNRLFGPMLAAVPEALTYLGTGHARGKMVISV
jgi:hypothetical protein